MKVREEWEEYEYKGGEVKKVKKWGKSSEHLSDLKGRWERHVAKYKRKYRQYKECNE